MEEVWKPVPGFEGYYEVSNYCRYKNRHGRIIKPTIGAKNRARVELWKNNKGKKYLIYRLAMQAFVPNPLNLPEVNHRTEDPTDNFIFVNPDGTVDLEKSTLEWSSKHDNYFYGSHLERIARKKRKTVLQYDFRGNFIRQWKSLAEIEETMGWFATNISKACRGKLPKAYGFIWKYL
jgi:hypothetical protein